MLGESALTAADAKGYHAAYANAIAAIGRSARDPDAAVLAQPSISVKLSALHPRYEFAQSGRVLAELVPALTELARIAKQHGIGMTIDAEEAERLELSLEILARVRRNPVLSGWEGLGLAVQAYQKRARCLPKRRGVGHKKRARPTSTPLAALDRHAELFNPGDGCELGDAYPHPRRAEFIAQNFSDRLRETLQ